MLEAVDLEEIFYRTSCVPLWKITRIECAQIQWFIRYRGETTE